MEQLDFTAYSGNGVECPCCGDEWETYFQYSKHWVYCGDDEHPLIALIGEREFIELYEKHGTTDLSEILPCSDKTITRVASELDVAVKHGGSIGKVASFHTRKRGHEYWQVYDGQLESYTVLVHRLVAVAEYGIDEVAGNDIHHKNGIPWDNRPENLEPMSHSEHSKLHNNDG